MPFTLWAQGPHLWGCLLTSSLTSSLGSGPLPRARRPRPHSSARAGLSGSVPASPLLGRPAGPDSPEVHPRVPRAPHLAGRCSGTGADHPRLLTPQGRRKARWARGPRDLPGGWPLPQSPGLCTEGWALLCGLTACKGVEMLPMGPLSGFFVINFFLFKVVYPSFPRFYCIKLRKKVSLNLLWSSP